MAPHGTRGSPQGGAGRAGGREVSDHALLLSPNLNTPPEAVDPRLVELKQMVLDTVISLHSKRNYANALDHLFAFAASRPLTRALLMEWRAGMEKDSLRP